MISFTGAAIGDLTYGWDENKNKTSETIGGTMSGYGFSVGFSGYDDEDRLVNWERTDTNLDQSWNLSAVGNWNSITENSSTQNRTHGPTHEMLTVASQGVTHDAKGNMTLIPAVLRPTNSGLPPTASRLTWDFENKLIAADTDNDSTDDIFYTFDALGRRVGRDDGTANVVYFQDGQQTIVICPSGTAAGSPNYTYVYASYIDEPEMGSGSGGLRYYHRNQQYSITAISDGGGSVVERYAYSAYGQVTIADASGAQISNSEISNRYTYTGREWDQGLSLYHYRARMYDAVGGRFVSRDPIGFEGSSWNIYEYIQSKPLIGVDPSGLRGLPMRPTPRLRTRPGGPRGPDRPWPGTPGGPPTAPHGPLPPGTGSYISPMPGTPEYTEWHRAMWRDYWNRLEQARQEELRRQKEKEWHDFMIKMFEQADEDTRRRLCPNVPPDTPINDIEPEEFDECWSQYEQCLDTVMSTWDGRARNRCYTCYQACTAAGGTWSGRMNGIDCAHWNTQNLP